MVELTTVASLQSQEPENVLGSSPSNSGVPALIIFMVAGVDLPLADESGNREEIVKHEKR
jgi:hypothetical protein